MGIDNKRSMTSLQVRPEFIMGLVLVCLTLAVYLHVRGFDFCNYDDDHYVYQNPLVCNGFSARGVAWAFTSMHAGNWHPLTWLSHMADCQLYGMSPGSHHLTSVILHVLNTLLLFTAFCRMTDMRWQSFFLAALFALHPLHVESVAWIAERKDVLSTFFMLLALNAYARYAAQPGRTRYLPVLGFFICGLLSKPMVVTFPVLLLLLDYWPLGRLGSSQAAPRKTTALVLLVEKAPLLACSALSTVVSFTAQLKGGAVTSLTDAPLQLRLANALVSCCAYLKDMFAPFRLGVFYPFPHAIPFPAAVLAAATVLAITLWVLRQRNRQPWLMVGWLWYLVALLPVIGIVKIGLQARADRYTYVALVGLGIAGIWGIASLLRGSRRSLSLGIVCGAALVSALMVQSYRQVHYWRNSITLFERALEVTHNNYIAHNNLGLALIQEGRLEEAVAQCRLSLKINPRCQETYVNLGLAFAGQGDLQQAAQSYRMALELKPDFSMAHNNLGMVLASQGRADDAIRHYTLAIKSSPDYAEAYNNMGNALLALNKPAEARDQFLRALQINPAYGEAHNNLGNAFTIAQEFDRALAHYQQAVRLLPKNPDVYCNLGNIYAVKGMLGEAVFCFRTALQLNPASENARRKLDMALQLQQAPSAQ